MARPSLWEGVPRGIPDGDETAFLPPSEKYADASVLTSPALAFQSGRMFLGVVQADFAEDEKGRPYAVGGRQIGTDEDGHMITVAGSRSGKGRSVIVPNMLHYSGSVLATDPKGELATMTARRRAEFGTVHVLDPFQETRGEAVGRRTGFNPIAAMRPDRLIEDAWLITDAIVLRSDRDPHWDESAARFICGLVLHVRTHPRFTKDGGIPSLIAVFTCATEGAPDPEATPPVSMKALGKEMLKNEAAGGAVQSAAFDFFDRPDRERSSVLSTARRHLRFIDLFLEPERPHGKEVLERHGFDLADLKKNPTTVYLCLPARHMGTCAGWLRLFINMALQAMELAKGIPPAKGVPVLFALDEFASLRTMQQVEDAAGQIAGFGVRLWVILQDLGQIKALYKDRWETFLGNAAVVQFFGNNDLVTLEWISKRLSRTTIIVTRKANLTGAQYDQGAVAETEHAEVYDLLSPGEAARIFGRRDEQARQLVICAGLPPMILQRINYDTHELGRDKDGRPLFDPPPDRVS